MNIDHSLDGSRSRSGVVLLIIVAIASVILLLMVGFFARMRNTAQAMNPVIQEAQNRLVLHAALMYLQETSRIGWDGEECFGWTDIRDGSLGPRGPRQPDGSLPAPSWWPGSDSSYLGSDGFIEDSALPASPPWPCPGATCRFNLAVYERTPYAIDLDVAPNPMRYNIDMYQEWEEYMLEWTGREGGSADGLKHDNLNHLTDDVIVGNPLAKGMLDPQPVADTWSDFRTGELEDGRLAVRSGTENRCWFRIYRERLGDHDALDEHDYVALSEYDGGIHRNKNWNVFIITCGAGATHGFKNWTEVEDAGQQALFANSRSLFEELRATERISWWRVEWSAQTGGGFDPDSYRNGVMIDNVNDLRNHVPKTFGGNFKWIQRLDREPEHW